MTAARSAKNLRKTLSFQQEAQQQTKTDYVGALNIKFSYPQWFRVKKDEDDRWKCYNCHQKLYRSKKKIECRHQEAATAIIQHLSRRHKLEPEEIQIEWAN